MATISQCRACGSSSLTPVLSELTIPDEPGMRANKNRDAFVLCDPAHDAKACGLVQRANHDPIHDLCPTPSSTWRVDREHLRSAATEALEVLSGRDCNALDIGCNDGTLLSTYPRWVERFGIDTDDIIREIGPWATTLQAEITSEKARSILGNTRFDIISCINMLEYDTDPAATLEIVANQLTDDGVFVLETRYAPIILTGTAIDQISPSLVSLFSLSTLEPLLREHGLKIFRGQVTGKNGGSLRVFATPLANEEYDFDPWNERLARLWDEETVLALQDCSPYFAFQERRTRHIERYQSLLKSSTHHGETIHLMGTDCASMILHKLAGPAATHIQHCVDFANRIDDLQGIPSDLTIISETDSRAMKPDFLLVPGHLQQEMLEYWREAILSGAKLIFLSPEPMIVDTLNYSAVYGRILALGDQAGGVESLRSILHAAGKPTLVSVNTDDRIAS